MNSHIIPEFFYRPLYDKKHRINTLILDKNKIDFEQKGMREKLLCSECERKIGIYESYVSRIFSGKEQLDVIYNNRNIFIRNLNYNKFKLFQLSLIWRASISNHWYFSNINLGPFEKEVRLMLINEDPGEPHYLGCMMVCYLNDDKRLQDELIMQPQQLRVDSHRAYGFIFGGALWLYIVSSHSMKFKHSDYYIDKPGNLKIFLKKPDKLLASIVQRFQKVGKALEGQ
jgi:hypothetical protein